jgi:hypothetical protein
MPAQHTQIGQPSHPSLLFYTPIDGQMGGVPLYNNNTSPGSHMDLNVLLSTVNWPEQLRQDGFELSDMWTDGPMAGTSHFATSAGQTYGYVSATQDTGYAGNAVYGNRGWP